MQLTYDEKQPLLSDGIVTVVGNIDKDAFINISWAIAQVRMKRHGQTIEVRFIGDGGWDYSYSKALIDLIAHDGNIKGVALGNLSGLMPYLWMSCSERVIGNSASISFKEPLRTESRVTLDEYEAIKLYQATILSNASLLTLEQAQIILDSVTSDAMSMNFDRVVNGMEMASPL